MVYNEVPVFSVIAEKSLDASHFASSSVSFSASSTLPLPPLAACCAVPLPSSSSYLSPHTPLLSCSRPPLPFLPSSASSNRTTRCHGCCRPYSPWAAIISPSPLSSTPCRASPPVLPNPILAQTPHQTVPLTFTVDLPLPPLRPPRRPGRPAAPTPRRSL
jgi:hypothetical protein